MSLILNYCAVAIAVSLTAVIVAGSVGIILCIMSVIFGKDSDNT